ncbi:uncharacterized protein N7515_008861 [Penicillium bovifimosum]|uniref:Uncharacterized protein n=1 Tax=Penicillium bovifimosum TaxID=126998 RepID=A0A9W9KY53_9EURO|nr:uncharacterized protein N7515_008861 [Penicillium bovifimosum]KAJ5125036.1 hypothetical protein N7515_008861 [Penicillium bovifimosum]
MTETRVLSKRILQAPLPDLKVGPGKTTYSELHDVAFVGTLSPWPDFEISVQACYDAQELSRSSTAVVTPGLYILEPEFVYIGDKYGVRRRFQQAIGQVLGVALAAQGVNLRFGDFACSGLEYNNPPDVVGLSTVGQPRYELRLLGTLKTPWVAEHSLTRAYDNPGLLRHLLGQPLLYMGDLSTAFGFLSTYDETISSGRSNWVPGNGWHNTRQLSIQLTSQSHGSGPSVTMRQCMFYVAKLASEQGPVNNQTPSAQWVVRY